MKTSHVLEEGEVRLGLAGGLLVVALLAVTLGGVPDADVRGILLTLTALLSLTVTRWGGLLLGVTCWALLTGFVTNRAGQLSLAPADLALLAASMVLAVGAAHVSARVSSGPPTTAARAVRKP